MPNKEIFNVGETYNPLLFTAKEQKDHKRRVYTSTCKTCVTRSIPGNLPGFCEQDARNTLS